MIYKGLATFAMAYKEYHDTEEEVSRPRAMTESSLLRGGSGAMYWSYLWA
jgi:hypothetical protein